jgi:hypothetical protein
MPTEISTSPKILKFEDISVEKLFSKNYPEDEKVISKSQISQTQGHSNHMDLIKLESQYQPDYNPPNQEISPEEKISKISSFDFSQVKPVTKEEFLMNDIFEKIWFLSFFHNGKFINYGPMNTSKIFLFLKNFYSSLPQIEKEKKNFMVVDSSCDVHFQPESLFEILTAEYDKKANLVVSKPENQKSFSLNPPSNEDVTHKKFDNFSLECGDKENLKPNFTSGAKTYSKNTDHQWKVIGKPYRREPKSFAHFKQEVVGMRKADRTKVHNPNSYHY